MWAQIGVKWAVGEIAYGFSGFIKGYTALNKIFLEKRAREATTIV